VAVTALSTVGRALLADGIQTIDQTTCDLAGRPGFLRPGFLAGDFFAAVFLVEAVAAPDFCATGFLAAVAFLAAGLFALATLAFLGAAFFFAAAFSFAAAARSSFAILAAAFFVALFTCADKRLFAVLTFFASAWARAFFHFAS